MYGFVFGLMITTKVREGEAERRRSEVQRFQRQMAQSMFLTYFRVIKHVFFSQLTFFVANLFPPFQGSFTMSLWCVLF